VTANCEEALELVTYVVVMQVPVHAYIQAQTPEEAMIKAERYRLCLRNEDDVARSDGWSSGLPVAISAEEYKR